MYLESIFTYLTWPVLIIIAFYLVRTAVKKFEIKDKQEESEVKTD